MGRRSSDAWERIIDTKALIKRVEKIHDLPTLPTVLQRIHGTLQDPSTSAADVGDLIRQDVSLTAKTLKLVNSAFYGFPHKIHSITRAIVILGFAKIKNIALSASIFDVFRGVGEISFDIEGFWEHSLGVAVATDVIALEFRLEERDDAFVAGLLHDIGKIIIAVHLRKEAEEIYRLIEEEGLLFIEAEERVFGAGHAVIGKWLAEKWSFPESLVVPTARHHSPALARQSRDLACAVHVADILVRALGIGSGGDPGVPEMDPFAWNRFELNQGRIERICDEILDGVSRADAFFELIR